MYQRFKNNNYNLFWFQLEPGTSITLKVLNIDHKPLNPVDLS